MRAGPSTCGPERRDEHALGFEAGRRPRRPSRAPGRPRSRRGSSRPGPTPGAGRRSPRRPRARTWALRWSSASRSTWCSSAYSAAGGDDARPVASRRRRPCGAGGPARIISADRQGRADRGPEPLREADGDGVEVPRPLGGRDARGDHGVEQPGAVEVHRQSVARAPRPRSRRPASIGWTRPPPRLWVFSRQTSRVRT